MCKKCFFAKKHVWFSIETLFGNFENLCVSGYKPKYSCTIMYECENSPPPHELSQIRLFNFFHLNLFQVNVICKK
jgi:hypothetical protein